MLAVGEGCGDALIDGGWSDTALGLAIGLRRLEGKSVIALDQFKRNARHGSGGTMLDGQDDAIVTVSAEIEVEIAPGMELRRSAQGLPGADGAGSFFCYSLRVFGEVGSTGKVLKSLNSGPNA